MLISKDRKRFVFSLSEIKQNKTIYTLLVNQLRAEQSKVLMPLHLFKLSSGAEWEAHDRSKIHVSNLSLNVAQSIFGGLSSLPRNRDVLLLVFLDTRFWYPGS